MSVLWTETWQQVVPYFDLALEDAVGQEGFPAPLSQLSCAAGTEERVIGSYTLVSRIGQGGAGTVWLARRSDGRFDGLAAVKLLDPLLIGKVGHRRFEREARILARLSHPHIAHLIDAGVSPGGQPYLVLERVDGQPIDRYCDERRMEVHERVRLFLDVLSAVTHAHSQLIVHSDIKPSNVLVTSDGRVKLVDFGIAKLVDGEGCMEPLTGEGERAMTPAYAAPEQVTGEPITTATDVYALGVLLYQLLCGVHPAGEALRSAAELFVAIVDAEHAPLSSGAGAVVEIARMRRTTPDRLRRMLRGDLDAIAAMALKKSPAERYRSVAALDDDLRRYLDCRPIGARPDALSYRVATFVRRNRAPTALAALAAIALLGGMAATIAQARRGSAHAARADSMCAFMLEAFGETPVVEPDRLRQSPARSIGRDGAGQAETVP